MRKQLLFAIVLTTLSCTKSKPIIVHPYKGVAISITDVRFKKSENRILGFVQIDNKSDNFVKLSNQELFLFSGTDSSRTFISTPGEWKIDQGLINVLKGKSITYRAFWPISHNSDSINAKYIEVLDRE